MLLCFFTSQTPLLSCAVRHSNRRFLLPYHDCGDIKRKRSSVRAVEKESQFEIDREKAREALQKLDQQLQSLSQKGETSSKKKRVSSSSSSPYLDPNIERELMTGMRTREMPEISGSYLAYTAVALVIFTIFYNIIFIIFIKPAVDGEEPPTAAIKREPLNLEMTQQAPPIADQR